MDEQFKVGDQVKFFEPIGRHIIRGAIEEINEETNRMSIREDGFDSKVSMSVKKINGRWLAFSLYDREWTLEVVSENKFLPGAWIKTCIRKLKNEFLKLNWATQRLLKRT